MTGIQEWWDAGEHVQVGDRSIFVARAGSGAPLTLLHGFPSSSHDWSKIAPALAAGHALLMPDFLGFGASDKPSDHVYSLTEQADIVEALWAQEGIQSTALVAHDYAVSVAQELLARRAERVLAVDIESVTFLNGGLYPDVHRMQPIQEALLDPEQGPKVGPLMNEELFVGGLASTFAGHFDHVPDGVEIWKSMARGDGHLISHRTIHYITDRRENEQRWVGALEHTDVPLSFIWGMQDPVSGAHMAQRIRERLPDAPILELDDVGHWPMLEAPDRVAAALLDLEHRHSRDGFDVL